MSDKCIKDIIDLCDKHKQYDNIELIVKRYNIEQACRARVSHCILDGLYYDRYDMAKIMAKHNDDIKNCSTKDNMSEKLSSMAQDSRTPARLVKAYIDKHIDPSTEALSYYKKLKRDHEHRMFLFDTTRVNHS